MKTMFKSASLLVAVLLLIGACIGCDAGKDADMIDVSFYLNDGTEDMFTVISGKLGSQALTPGGEPEREGYLFAGWFTDQEGLTPYDANPSESISVYAKWALPCTVSFVCEGAVIPDAIVPAGSLLPVPAPSLPAGSVINGWYTDSQATIPWDFAVDIVSGNMTLYADQGVTGFMVALHLGGGAVSTVMAAGPLLTPPETPGREGYAFVAWFKDEALTIPWDFAVDTVTGDVNLYAKWEESVATFTVTFDSNGGGSVDSLTGVGQGSLINQPPSPRRSGYTFGGWYKDAELRSAWQFDSDRVTGETVLYAKWNRVTSTQSPTQTRTPTYTVTFNSNGGSSVSSIRDVESGMTIGRPSDPIRSGYTFGGWYRDSGLTSAWSFGSDEVTRNITLYAKWTTGYTVSFSSNGGTAIAPYTNIPHGATITQPSAPVRTGYAFGGWYRDSGLTSAWVFASDVVTGNITLYARWTMGFTVTFDSNGGTTVAPYTGVFSGVVVPAPTAPTRAGYVFAGWYRNGTAWNFATPITSDIALSAMWTEAPNVTVAFDANGGTSPASQTVKAGESVTLPALAGRENYIFIGWFTAATSGSYVGGAGSTYKPSASLTLYAQWQSTIAATPAPAPTVTPIQSADQIPGKVG